MLFNSFAFLVFFPAVVLVFLVIPKRLRSIWLLVASYYFYMSWNPTYAILIGASTLVTYLSGLWMERCETTAKKKLVIALSLVINLGILAVFKYANFALDTLDALFALAHIPNPAKGWHLDLLLPVGISFYTFQAVGYTIDVYRKNIPAEKNFLNYALFVSFFPQLVAGPIERSGSLLKQIQNIQSIKLWEYERVRDGLLLMLWGFFQKLVIADRASILVNYVFGRYQKFGFVELALAAILFAFQIYCDFGGYTNIARGAAKVMGFKLMENFRQPYLATSIKDFWRRWHISLTTWFTDYLYIPLGGNRKGQLRKYLNILIVFFVSGLWHGASWHFVAWGLMHAVFQIAGDVKERLKNRFVHKPPVDSFSRRLRKRLCTFVLVDGAWLLFAADSVRMAWRILKQMFTGLITTSVYSIGLDMDEWKLMLGAIILLLAVDVLHERGVSIFKLVQRQELWLRALLYAGLAWVVILFGVYGAGYDVTQFIYFQF